MLHINYSFNLIVIFLCEDIYNISLLSCVYNSTDVYLWETEVNWSEGWRILQVVKVYVELVWGIHFPGKLTRGEKESRTEETAVSIQTKCTTRHFKVNVHKWGTIDPNHIGWAPRKAAFIGFAFLIFDDKGIIGFPWFRSTYETSSDSIKQKWHRRVKLWSWILYSTNVYSTCCLM